MKKIAFINTYSDGSTGNLINGLSYNLPNDFAVKKYYGRCKNTTAVGWTFIGENRIKQFFSNVLTYLSGKIGSYHKSSTKKLIKELMLFKPDIIHIHNIHGNYLNFNFLFKYLRKANCKVVFTIHDEFLLTGRCALMACDKWKNGCSKCRHLKAYPRALIDYSNKMQKEKRKMIRELNPYLVFPSKWLFGLFKPAYATLKSKVINNGIKLSESPSKHDATKPIKLLFVANPWSVEKGSQIICELRSILPPEKYEFIVVGTDKNTRRLFCDGITFKGILSKHKLFELYKSSDIFVNPTLRDNFPTVLIEAISCGLPCITFNTGGCAEIIDHKCGVVINEKTTQALAEAICSFKFEQFNYEGCISRSKQFSIEKCASEYAKLYNYLVQK